MASNITDQDKISGYLKLIEIQNEYFFKRRDLEWKVTLYYWASIAILTWFLLFYKVSIDHQLLLGAYIIIFLASATRICLISRGHSTDKLFIRHYRNLLEDMLKRVQHHEHKCSKELASYWTFVTDPWAWIHLWITVVMLLVSYLIITQPAPS
jgi:hypothetical protein